jgi:hypothetical protein
VSEEGFGTAAGGSTELGRDAPIPRVAVPAALAVAAGAAATIPGQPIGLGVFLVATGSAIAVSLWRPRDLSPNEAILSLLALALVGMSVIRSAEWLLAFDFLGAVGLGALAVTGGVTWAEVFGAVPTVVARLFVAGGYLGRPLAGIAGRLGRHSPALRGAVLGAGLLAVFGGLFAAADPAFSHLAGQVLVPEWDLSLLPARILVFGVVLLGIVSLAAAGPRYMVARGAALSPVPRRGLVRLEWAVALGLLDLLFAAFVAVQIAVLFGGRDHVLRTAGLTYAEYARQGFFQLVAVAALTLGVVAGAVRWSRLQRAADRRLLQALLGLLSVLTLVVLVSALRRLLLYEETFGFTRLRVSVHATILWLGALFILILVGGVLWKGRWLPRACVILTATGLLLFSLANPDRLVAEQNVQRYRATGEFDLAYAAGLSADAVPAFDPLPAWLRDCALQPHAGLRSDQDSVLGWNLARERARRVLTSQGVPSCRIPSGAPGSGF